MMLKLRRVGTVQTLAQTQLDIQMAQRTESEAAAVRSSVLIE